MQSTMNCFAKSEGFNGETLGAEIFALCFFVGNVFSVNRCFPKDPGMSSERDWAPYNPMTWRWDFDHQSYDFSGWVWILRVYKYKGR